MYPKKTPPQGIHHRILDLENFASLASLGRRPQHERYSYGPAGKKASVQRTKSVRGHRQTIFISVNGSGQRRGVSAQATYINFCDEN